MKACQALTGQGGWPLSCFITPEGLPLFAGTYFPLHDKGDRPGILRLAQAIQSMWTEQKSKLMADSVQILQAIARDSSVNEDADKVTPTLLEQGLEELRLRFDSLHGGFGQAPKFPRPHNLLYLLRRQALSQR